MLAAFSAFAHGVAAQDDDFAFFRCDACSATFFQVNRIVVKKFGHRRGSGKARVPAFEFVEALEDICESTFTKEHFGVKQFEGKKYLFGPGVSDHIPGQGFGQMGMGDYDKRLAAYCRMFVEDMGEEELLKKFLADGAIDKTELCKEECSSSASGQGARSKEPRKPKRPLPAPRPTPPPVPRPRPRPRPRPGPRPEVPIPAPAPAKLSADLEAATGEVAELLKAALAALPRLAPSQLRLLGDALLGELAGRAAVAEAGAAAKRAASASVEL